MAASVLAIGLTIDPAVSLPLGGKVTGADTAIQEVQQDRGMGQGPGAGGPGQGAGQGGPAARESGGGAMRGGGGVRDSGGGIREGGAQFRSGERGMRGNGSARLRAERGLRGDRGVEFGYRERGVRDRDRGRADIHIDRDRDRRRFGRRGGIYIEPGYGYLPANCTWLRRRALATDSPYWWRRYRACTG
jgi:hypothetical protein